jgi:hypothetical protein
MYDFSIPSRKILVSLTKFSVLVLAIGSFSALNRLAFAQIRGNGSQEFFDEGDRQMDRDIQTLENPPDESPSLQQEEQNLERDLNVREKDPNAPEEEEIPSPQIGDGDNVAAPPPIGETEVKFPVP